MKATREVSQETVDAIVKAALAEFSERGYAACTLSAVARRARVTLKVIHRYFPTRDELFRDVVRFTVIDSFTTREDVASESGMSAVEEVRQFARRYWISMERPEMVALMRLTIGELPHFPELAVFHTAESLERFLHMLERIIAGGVARGELRTSDVRASARTVLATLAAHSLWFAYPDIYSSLTGADRERASAATIETLIQSLDPVRATVTSENA
jgi:TetR/AcrR family transcriptional regulator